MRGIDMIAGKKRHVILFPEGGRFNDGTVHDFLRGFAIIARKTGRPVIPIYMPYNGRVYPPQSFWIYWHKLKAVIGKPFVLQDNETDEAFIARVHGWFEQQAAEIKNNS
jgi:1-acyl-sn-glycerol-3-phosphate acyltransferase